MLIFAPFKIVSGHDKSPHQGGIFLCHRLSGKSKAAPRGVVETPPRSLRYEPEQRVVLLFLLFKTHIKMVTTNIRKQEKDDGKPYVYIAYENGVWLSS